MIVKDRSQKMESVRWRDCKWLQPEEFADMRTVDLERLLESIKRNGIIDPLDLWVAPDGTKFIIDGHHRQIAFQEFEKRKMGEIPDTLHAVFYEFETREQAILAVLAKRSAYSKVNDDKVYEWLTIESIDYKGFVETCVIPGIDPGRFEKEFYLEHNLPMPEPGEIEIKDFGNECPKCGYRW
jgi:hypothetical protein